ncbi:MAG: SOS response-associated peptidase [Eubacteriales bacterium]|nr:SOS response-associated peptidase [Eubacteriales bacterium]
MCGRYYFDEEVSEAVRQLTGELEAGIQQGDVHPSEKAVVLTSRGQEMSAELMPWGFPKYEGKGLVINARAETALVRPMFRDSVKMRRCVIPARHFYEWDKDKNKVTFKSIEDKVLYMAGMFDTFQGEDRFLIITTQANESMSQVHDRMPLILDRAELEAWLCDGNSTEDFLRKKPRQLAKEQEYEQQRLPFL